MLDNEYSQPVYPQPDQLLSNKTKPIYSVKLLSRLKTLLQCLGPAFVVSVAYIDPGNFATNISGGSKFNYTLLWVILWSNLMAIFLQSMSAKLGIATGHNLPQMCGKVFSRRVNWCFWVMAELAAMATDLAEFLGSTLGFYLLFHIPMLYAGLITVFITFFIVYLGKYGQRVIELIITVLVAVISISYAVELILAKPDWSAVSLHVILPSLPNGEAVLIAVGILGATVMPHVIYLHSQLVQHRNKNLSEQEKKSYLKMERFDIILAMNIAFVVNAAMLIVSAAVFYRNGIMVDTIEQAKQTLSPLLGAASGAVFAIALISSGLSSSAVGTMAGQTVMQGFVGLKISDNVTRLVTMLPGMCIILIGVNPMLALVISQVILSFILPAAIIPMLIITNRRELMGSFKNSTLTNVIGWIISIFIIAANGLLLGITLTGRI